MPYLAEVNAPSLVIWEVEHLAAGERHYAVWKPVVEQN
jgi:hypothetical protein